MLVLYFSGTGNTKYIAEYFAEKMQAKYYSIEKEINFSEQLNNAEIIAFCYPIYGSTVPIIMREFVLKYKDHLSNKKIIIFCTQNLFSGDGARVFTELLENIDYNIIYAEHFNMPNNICNLFFYPLASKKKIKKYIEKANKKVNNICNNIDNKIIKKRGFNCFSKYLGLVIQRTAFSKIEKKAKKDVRIALRCNQCLLCVEICPMKNLQNKENIIVQKGNCTFCYRCVNACPKKAITVLWHGKVKKQYTGI